MGTVLVVAAKPAICDVSYLVEGVERGQVEDFITVRAVEPLDVGVLVRLARLDVAKLDTVAAAPVDECLSCRSSDMI